MSCKFFGPDGRLVPAVTAEQMREIDRIAVEETGPNLFQMMENAGRSLAELTLQLLGRGWQEAEILILAGTGGNGGGGICAARHLANRQAQVRLLLTDAGSLKGVPSAQYTIYRHAGGREITCDDLGRSCPGIIIDALVGYGLRSAATGTVLELIRWADSSAARVLALDVPSGVDATTGDRPGEAIRPEWTMTLALPKTGLLPERSGQLFLADLGIPAETFRRAGLKVESPFSDRGVIPLKSEPVARSGVEGADVTDP
ncbi:MAG: NAD(P)H-hydrate epimerase [Acidobacteriota bacterium]